MGAAGTASRFVGPAVFTRMLDEWGEAAWTARDLFWPVYHRTMSVATARFLVGLPALP